MNLKKLLKEVFWYTESSQKYDFILPEDNNKINNSSNDIKSVLDGQTVYSELQKNVDYITVKYNSLINSDIIMRPFSLLAKGKEYNALLFCIDGMVDSNLINNFILRPLMSDGKNKSKPSPAKAINVNVKKIQKFNLEDYIYNNLIPQNTISKHTNFDEIISKINMGNCAIFIDTLQIAFTIDVKGFETRNISTPNNEIVVRGSQEAFVEKLRTNTSMLRRLVNNENLIIENTNVGKISKTKVAICYMQNITNNELVAEVKYRINNLDIDYIISSGQLEQLIQDNSMASFPQMIATERPDKATNHILEGRVVVLVDGSPYSLIMPGVLIDFLSSPEDMNLKFQYSNLLKIIRLLAFIITLLLPGLYVAITNYHSELIPTELLFTIAASRNSVPFPVIFEILLMEFSFELIREAGLRVPTPIGPTIGIVGALILGEAAVSANLVSPILIIIVSITGICSFAIPDFSLGFALRIFRFAYIILGYIAGFLGIALGIFIQFAILANLKSFGAYYLAPYLPVTNLDTNISYFIPPIWKREKRADFLKTKHSKSQPKISMKWKFWQ